MIPTMKSLHCMLSSSCFLLLVCGLCLAEKAIYITLTEPRSASETTTTSDFHDWVLSKCLELESYTKLYSYKSLDGFAVHTSARMAEQLKSCDGVLGVVKDRGSTILTTHTPEILGLSQLGGVWQDDGGVENSGEGIVIGLIDTGINPKHPSFRNRRNSYPVINNINSSMRCDVGPLFPRSSCNGKIIGARVFAKGAIAANKSIDVLSPFDATGHGSHTASIAAGNFGVKVKSNSFSYGRASGMAPRARIVMYKAVFFNFGTEADMVAAIDKAIEDKVDILSLSLKIPKIPSPSVSVLDPFEVALFNAHRAGIFVVQAAGNAGPDPFTLQSLAPWITTVGSTNTDRRYSNKLVFGNGSSISGLGLSKPVHGGPAKMIWVTDADISKKHNKSLTCERDYGKLSKELLKGNILVCEIDLSVFLDLNEVIFSIQKNLSNMGVRGFIIANTEHEVDDFLIEQGISFTMPAMVIPTIRGTKKLKEYYESKTIRGSSGEVISFGARGSIRDSRHAHFGMEAPIVSSFSSRGPDVRDNKNHPLDVLKPDIVAPGSLIWGAWSPVSMDIPYFHGENFALESGTSMAAPHLSGIAALIKQKRPGWSPSMIKSAIVTSASKLNNRGHRLMAYADGEEKVLATHFDSGAGYINASAALNPGLTITPSTDDYIAFMCSLPNVSHKLVRRATGEKCSRKLSYLSDLNLPSVTISDLNGSRTTRRSVTNVAEHVEAYMVSLQNSSPDMEVDIAPAKFLVSPGQTVELTITIRAIRLTKTYSFAEIALTGSRHHVVTLPLSVFLS